VANNQLITEGKSPEQAESMELNWEEIEKLRNLLGTLEKRSRVGTSNLAFIGITSTSLTLHASDLTLQNTWILDSKATNHMIPSSHKCLSYKPFPITKKIVLLDGSLTTVTRQGDILITTT